MPCCAIVGGKILCMHGGLSPSFLLMKDIPNSLNQIQRPCAIPDWGPYTDLVWADPVTAQQQESFGGALHQNLALPKYGYFSLRNVQAMFFNASEGARVPLLLGEQFCWHPVLLDPALPPHRAP